MGELKRIICELDYKGYYKRFALTIDEFRKRYGDIPYNGDEKDLYPETIGFCVHLNIHHLVEVDSKEWKDFFLDLADGLPESDIKEGNIAYIDWGEMEGLHDTMELVAWTISTGYEKLYYDTYYKEG